MLSDVLKTFNQFECSLYRIIHVEIFVLGQAPTHDGLLIRNRPVFLIQRVILLVIDRVIGNVSLLPFGTVFPADNRLVGTHVIEPLVLDDSRVRFLV